MGQGFSMQTALITSGLTIVGGVLVFILSQLVLKLIIEPISDFRKIKSQISSSLVFYANIYSNPIDLNEDNLNNEAIREELANVRDNFRRLASELIGCIQVIPCYNLFSLFQVVPSRKNVDIVSSNLIGISNSLWEVPNSRYDKIDSTEKRKQEICKLLRIR